MALSNIPTLGTTYGFGGDGVYSTGRRTVAFSTRGSGQSFPIPGESGGEEPSIPFSRRVDPPTFRETTPPAPPASPPNGTTNGGNLPKPIPLQVTPWPGSGGTTSPTSPSGGATDPSRRVETSTTGLPNTPLDTSKFQKASERGGGPYIWKYNS